MYEVPYWIAGLAVPDIVSHLADHGLDCEGPRPRGETMSSWECRPPSKAGGVEREVSIVGQDRERIRSVTARVSGDDSGMPPEEAAADFLGFVATLPYEGADPARGGAVGEGERDLRREADHRNRELRALQRRTSANLADHRCRGLS
jgi:hypothetical protein